MEFKKNIDNNGKIYLHTPDGNKTKERDFKIKSNGIARASSKIKDLYSEIF